MMLYPFFYRPPSLSLEQGWQLFPPERYFQRVASQVSPDPRDPAGTRLCLHSVTGSPLMSPLPQTSKWRLSTVNRDFSACPSYPPAVMVPAAVGDDTVTKAARFRHGGRFPVLSYFHPKNGTVSPFRPSAPLSVRGGTGLGAPRAPGGGIPSP